MSLVDPTIIIADDLTGANDTALQFFKKGCSAKIIINYRQDFSNIETPDVWAISTESRNVDKETAYSRVLEVTKTLKESLNVEKFYKKIDSTLRGHIGPEIIAVLEATNKEVAFIAPAYIEENRATLGGYQLLNGIPIERTQCALDPKMPIFDSYIPDILKKDLNPEIQDLIGVIGLRTITKGAGPISLKIKELIQQGKKLIVLDAMSTTDLDQIALAIDKSEYDILPCASAGLAASINKCDERNINKDFIKSISNLPRLIISGSATNLSRSQIEKLREEKSDISFFDLTVENVITEIDDTIIDKIASELDAGNDVVIHSSSIHKDLVENEGDNLLIDAAITKTEFSDRITGFLSEVVYRINSKSNFILIMVGGETSYKCAYKINSGYLEILDAIMPAIPLCIDMNKKIIVTKSGNFGSLSTLIDIINYFDKFRE